MFIMATHRGREEDEGIAFLSEYQHLEFTAEMRGFPFVILFMHSYKYNKKTLRLLGRSVFCQVVFFTLFRNVAYTILQGYILIITAFSVITIFLFPCLLDIQVNYFIGIRTWCKLIITYSF